jgi:glycosyltransferase involved in cell wall biosynthesis
VRILAVTHAYPRWDGDVAGSFLERLYRALVARGHAVHVVAPSDEGRGGGGERCGITIEGVRYASPARETLAYRGTLARAVRSPAGLWSYYRLVRAMARAVAARSALADVVHASWWTPAGMAAAWARSRGAPPYVVTLHGTDAALLRGSRAARWLARPVLRRAAAATAVSQFLATAARLGGAAGDIHVIPMPAEVAGPERPPAAGDGGVVTVGRLTRQKRLHLLLEAIAWLKATGRAVPLAIIGDGPERQALEAQAHAAQLDELVRFVGAVPPQRVPALIADASVFAFPALAEGFGLAAAEALMMGLPLVVFDDGGGVLDVARAAGDAAIVVPTRRSADLGRAIALLLDDRDARVRARRAGAALRVRLEPDTIAAEFERVFVKAARG